MNYTNFTALNNIDISRTLIIVLFNKLTKKLYNSLKSTTFLECFKISELNLHFYNNFYFLKQNTDFNVKYYTLPNTITNLSNNQTH